MCTFRLRNDVFILSVPPRLPTQDTCSTKNFHLSAPIAFPIAKLLDLVLGANEAHTYKKAELKSFLQFHRQGEEPLRDDEIKILNGVLELNNKSVEQLMTPLKVRDLNSNSLSRGTEKVVKDVVSLSANTILDHKTVDAM